MGGEVAAIRVCRRLSLVEGVCRALRGVACRCGRVGRL